MGAVSGVVCGVAGRHASSSPPDWRVLFRVSLLTGAGSQPAVSLRRACLRGGGAGAPQGFEHGLPPIAGEWLWCAWNRIAVAPRSGRSTAAFTYSAVSGRGKTKRALRRILGPLRPSLKLSPALRVRAWACAARGMRPGVLWLWWPQDARERGGDRPIFRKVWIWRKFTVTAAS